MILQTNSNWKNIYIVCDFLLTEPPYPVSISLPPRPDHDGGEDELEDTSEDKDHAEEHPDVKERDVRDSRNTLSNLEYKNL